MRIDEIGLSLPLWAKVKKFEIRCSVILLVFTIGEKEKVHKGFFINSSLPLRETKQKPNAKIYVVL